MRILRAVIGSIISGYIVPTIMVPGEICVNKTARGRIYGMFHYLKFGICCLENSWLVYGEYGVVKYYRIIAE